MNPNDPIKNTYHLKKLDYKMNCTRKKIIYENVRNTPLSLDIHSYQFKLYLYLTDSNIHKYFLSVLGIKSKDSLTTNYYYLSYILSVCIIHIRQNIFYIYMIFINLIVSKKKTIYKLSKICIILFLKPISRC